MKKLKAFATTSNCFSKTTDSVNRLIVGYPFLYSVVVILLLIIINFSVFTPYYENNDDVIMSFLSNGVLNAGVTADHTIFSNVIIGKLLSLLYESLSVLPWYPIYLVTVFYFCCFVIVYYFSLTRLSWMIRLMLLLCLFGISVLFMTKLQFTRIAIFAGMTGFTMVVYCNFLAGYRRNLIVILGIMCILLSSIIRFEAFVLSFLCTAPIIVIRFIESFRHQTIKHTLAILTVVVCLTALVQFIQWQSSKSGEWEWFYRIQKFRSSVIDYGHITYDVSTRDKFDSLSISHNDFLMLSNWMLVDSNTISNIDLISRIRSQVPSFGDRDYVKPFMDYAEWIKNVLTTRRHLLLVFFIAMILFINHNNNKVVLLILWILSGFAFIALFMKLNPRIFIPVVCMVPVIQLASMDSFRPVFSSKHARCIILSAAILITLTWTFDQVIMNRNQRSDSIDYQKNITSAQIHDKIVYVWGRSMRYEKLPAFEIESFFRDYKLIPIGWYMHSPYYYRHTAMLYIGDPITHIINDPGSVIISDTMNVVILKNYINEHRHITTDLIQQSQLSDDGFVYRIYSGRDSK